VLTSEDSGTNGHEVIYRAHPNEAPVLSGAVPINGPWTLVDSTNNIYEAAIDPTIATRQLYVNGARAVRARGMPTTFTMTATGYTTGDGAMAAYANPTDIEVVSQATWKLFRCGVGSIAGSTITIQNPCWTNAQLLAPGISVPNWIENARELLDEEGEFYIDRTRHVVAYKPRTVFQPAAGTLALEDMSQAIVVAPVLETLMRLDGTLDAPVHDVRFEGITFAEATWLRPSTPDGYASMQAGVGFVGSPAATAKTPGNVVVRAAHGIHFVNDTFTRLGAVGLAFEAGCYENEILGNRFEDISGAAMTIGDVVSGEDAHPSDSRAIVVRNVVRDNYVTRIGAEYLDAPGIMLGYAQSTTVDHNELFDLPYTGISIGWGWGSADSPPTPAHDNAITNNQVSHVMLRLDDGAAVYTLGAQHGSTITGNYLHDRVGQYGGLVSLDNGTQFWSISGNLIVRAPYWIGVQKYDPIAQNNVITGNYVQSDSDYLGEVDHNSFDNNTSLAGSWPPAAVAIAATAGLDPAYQSMHLPNIAAGKTSSASSAYNPDFVASQANDGDARTGWSSQAEPEPEPQYWQVDLGAAHTISAVEIATRVDYDQTVTRTNFEVWGSNDASFATHDVLGAQGPSPLPYKAIWSTRVAGDPQYRYIRITKTTLEYFFLSEVRVLSPD
jgi:hypothetical protein